MCELDENEVRESRRSLATRSEVSVGVALIVEITRERSVEYQVRRSIVDVELFCDLLGKSHGDGLPCDREFRTWFA